MLKQLAILLLTASTGVLITACAGNTQMAPETAQRCDAPEVRQVVEQLGMRLKRVSVLAPERILKQSISENYAPLVTSTLLNSWLAHPVQAPGKRVSSPWPERIEINSVKPAGAGACVVTGNVIYITSVEVEQGGAAARKPVTLRVRKTDRWRISAYSVSNSTGQ